MPRAVIASPSDVIAQPGADQRFRGTYRLRKTDEFSSVFAFRRAYKGRFLIVHYRPGALETARLGVVVAKRLARRATQRNMIKRIVREQFRKKRAMLKAQDVVVRLHAPVERATRAMINDDIVQLLGRLQR